MASRRARERQNSRPWEQEPDDHRHDGDFPPMDEEDEDEQEQHDGSPD